MADFYRDTKTFLRKIFVELSQLLEEVDVGGAVPRESLKTVYLFIRGAIQKRGGLEVALDPGGSVAMDGVVIDTGSENDRSLARILSRAGIREILVTPALDQEALTLFVQTVALLDGEPLSTDADLVTWWFEEGSDSIQLVSTSLSTADMCQTELASMRETRALSSMVEGSSSLDELPVSGQVERGSLSRLDHGGISEHFKPMKSEDDQALRRQTTASLMAALSAKTPVLSVHELGFLCSSILEEQMQSGEWDDILRSIRNLEFMVDPDTQVSSHARAGAQAVLDRTKSGRSLIKIVQAVAEYDADSPPFKLLRWMFGNKPLPLWKDAANKLPLDQVNALVLLFTTCYAFQHPFWRDALKAVSGERQSIVKESIAQLETQWMDTSEASDTEKKDDSSDFSWDEFDLDSLDDQGNELDASLIAFLDASDSSLGPANRQQPDSEEVKAVQKEMLDELEALEKSIISRDKEQR